MIRNCKNCAGRLIYDVQKHGLSCGSCGTIFPISAYENLSSSTDDKNSDNPEDEMLDVNIFACSSCGAEISVTDTEASTFCIYCGNPNVILSRVGKMKKPDAILPFTISKEDALRSVREHLSKGFFVPRSIKNFEPEMMRGIYIPYYVTKVETDSRAVVAVTTSNGNRSITHYHIRAGYASMPYVSTDASTMLSDNLSQRVEPYRLKELEEFNENYLLGFYSDQADINRLEAKEMAKQRAHEAVDEKVLSEFGSNAQFYRNVFAGEIYEEPKLVMLPAWFLTLRYKDKPYTIVVNGQTGKTVGGMPWNKAIFIALVVLLSIVFAVAATFIFYGLFYVLVHAKHTRNSSKSKGKLIGLIVAAIVAAFSAGISKIRKVLASISRATENSLISFVSKRQKGD